MQNIIVCFLYEWRKLSVRNEREYVIDRIVDIGQDKHNPYSVTFTESNSIPTRKMKHLNEFLGNSSRCNTFFLLCIFHRRRKTVNDYSLKNFKDRPTRLTSIFLWFKCDKREGNLGLDLILISQL